MYSGKLKALTTRQWFARTVALAVLVRLFLLWRYYCISSDGVVYLRAAGDFYGGQISDGLASVYPPGYPLLVAALYPLIGEWELAGQIVSLLFGIAILFPLFAIFALTFNEKIALIGTALVAISPYLALYSVHVRSESTYLFLSCWVVYLVLAAGRSGSMWQMGWAGVLGGYAYLVRPEAIGFLVLVPLYLVYLYTSQTGFSVGRVSRSIAAVVIGFLFFALPYIAYLSIDTGRIGAISRKAGITLEINLREAGYRTTDSIDGTGDAAPLVFTDYVRQHPVSYLQKVISDLPEATWVFLEAIYYAFIPFLMLGLYLMLREKFWQRLDFPLLGFVLFYVYGFALVYVKRRYALQAVPIALGWVALGIYWLWDYLTHKLAHKRGMAVGLVIGMFLLVATLPKTLKPVSLEKAYVREAGMYLRGINKAGLRVAVLDDRVTFYARADTVLLTPQDSSNLVSRLREERVDYLAGETKALGRFHPGLIAHPEQFGLTLEKTFLGTRNDQMLVFKVV